MIITIITIFTMSSRLLEFFYKIPHYMKYIHTDLEGQTTYPAATGMIDYG